jgi:hypothetical protein
MCAALPNNAFAMIETRRQPGEFLSVLLALDHKYDRRMEHFRKVIKNLVVTLLVGPSADAVRPTLIKPFGLSTDDLIAQSAGFVRVVVGRHDDAPPPLLRPKPKGFQCLDHRLLITPGVTVRQNLTMCIMQT